MNVSRKTTILVSLLLGAVAPSACTVTSTNAGNTRASNDAGAADSGPPLAAINGVATSFTGGDEGDYLGQVVASAADGSVALTGAPLEQDLESGTGAAYSFAKSSGTWATSGVQISPTSGVDGFGASVTSSADGSTIAISAVGTSNSVFVFSKSGATWKQVAQLAPTATAQTGFGSAIALSADGKTLAVGAPDENTRRGNVYVYASASGSWTQNAHFSSSETTSGLGTSVALSSDGTTLAVGATGGYDDGVNGPASGEACVFTFDGSSWGEAAMLNQATYVHVAISSDGSTVAASHDFAVDVFAGANGNWTTTTSLAPAGGGADPLAGGGLAMSADGRRIAFGAPAHGNSGGGFVFIFDLGFGAWSQSGSFTSPSGAVNEGQQFGQAVAISGDGSTIEVGSPNELSQKGALYILQ